MAATPLPPSTIGSGALYSPTDASLSHQQPPGSPIAHFASLPNDGIGNETYLKRKDNNLPSTLKEEGGVPTAGRLLAVNSSYIAYAVKKGLVRVIDRKSASKTLLRGHDDDTRMIDAAFFGGGDNSDGVGGLWDELSKLRQLQTGGAAAATGGANGNKAEVPALASDVLATLGGIPTNIINDNDASSSVSPSILIWRVKTQNSNLGADKLLEIRYANANRIVWHPFNPNKFVLLCRNLGGNGNIIDNNGGGGRTVAMLVETTKLVTRPHETEGYMVCDCKPDEAGNIPGMTPLVVTSDDDDTSSNLSLAGANDVTWSNKDARHVLTAHDDGVRLWDFTAKSTIGGKPYCQCVSKVDVISPTAGDGEGDNKKVTRVLFLSRYEDGNNNKNNTAITPPFITGTDMNHTITLWSAFPSGGSSNTIGTPTRLRVFGLRDQQTRYPLSSMVSVELIPAPYRPPLQDETTATVPSSFVLLAERKSGVMHALHLDTDWGEDVGGGETGDAVSAVPVVVKGFDYVVTLNVVHPMYSYCVAPAAKDGDNAAIGTNALKEERDVELCCIQSKAVQMLTLSAEVCSPPSEDIVGLEPGDLALGVTLLDLPPVGVTDDEDDDGADDLESFEGEEYDMEEEDGVDEAEYSTNTTSGGDDDEDDNNAVPAVPPATSSEPNAFSNWLGAIANPLPPPTATTAAANVPPTASIPVQSTSPPPPGLGFASAILPPPPGMVADATGSQPSTLLSPMEILSASMSNDSEPPVARSTSPAVVTAAMPAKSTSPVPPPFNKPAPAAKKATKKKQQQGNKNAPIQPPGPMKILQRDEVTTGGPITIDGIVQHAVNQNMNSQEANILSAMVKIIVAEVGSSVRSSFKEASADTKQGKSNNIDNKSIEAAVQRGVTSGLASGLESSLKKGVEGGLDRALADKGALSKRLERHAKESAERAAKEAVTAMQPTILNSLNQSMREVMIPAYENATRQMFQQTSKSLEQGLAQMSLNQANSIAASSSSVAPTLQAMSNQMMKMSEVIQSLSAEVAQLRAASGGNQSVNLQQQHQGRGGPPQQPLPVDIRSEIKSLCQARRYEEAFTKAVSATEGDIVLFACNNADIAAVFNNGEQPSISQPILICLMQQLGAVLVTATDARDLKVILTWLQEIAVTIDPTNVNIQRHVGSVVQQLLANINTKMSNCDPAFRRPLQTLMQVIGGVEAAARTRQQG